MNGRERFLRCMQFKPVDRVHNWEVGPWGQTIDRWHEEGMPRDVHVPRDFWDGNEFFGLDRIASLDINLDFLPEFDEIIVEETDRYLISWRTDGILTKAMKEGTSRGMRMSMDQYIEFPVKTRQDFEAVKWRLDPASPARYPPWWDDEVRCVQGCGYPLQVPKMSKQGNIGLYSRLREWMGTVAACTVFYDDPAFAEEMLDVIADLIINTMERALNGVKVDIFNWWEDFAYNSGPLISPKIFKKFMMPRYRRVNDFLRSHGVEIIIMDTDGNPTVLLPLMIEVGFDGFWPIECAAGMDPVKLRAEFGHDLAMMGGIDKRVLAQDKKAIEAELLYKVPDLIEDGGYIPGIDHALPPDAPYENWLFYLDFKRKLLEGRFGA
jgi:uroporphyrinogen decarboxylase